MDLCRKGTQEATSGKASYISRHSNSSKLYNLYTKSPLLLTSKFEGLGKLQDNYHIKLKPDAQPYALTTPRRVAAH